MDKIKERLKELAPDGKITCQDAFSLAEELKCPVDQVGRMCDELKIKIKNCRLGCF